MFGIDRFPDLFQQDYHKSSKKAKFMSILIFHQFVGI